MEHGGESGGIVRMGDGHLQTQEMQRLQRRGISSQNEAYAVNRVSGKTLCMIEETFGGG